MAGKSRQYRHPGQVFVSRYGVFRDELDIMRYGEFLRQEAGLSDEPPIDLSQIYHHFGMPTPLRAPLEEQQGILLDSRNGVILIKEDDPLVRQRFTEGHELMELLFDAWDTLGCHCPQDADKERLCDRGAADLLMPQTSFLPRLQTLGLSLNTGRTLAELYETSLLATLMRMIQQSSGHSALIVWHSALSRRDLVKKPEHPLQLEKKLRIWWRVWTPAWNAGFIAKNKSIAPDSVIAQAYHSGRLQIGTEILHLGGQGHPIACKVEAMPVQVGNKACVVSLLHLIRKP